MNIGSKEKFIKIYANVPLGARQEIVLLINDGDKKIPISWDVAYNEIIEDTPFSKTILEKLEKFQII